MRVEYQMAIESQHASKDKWYAKYYEVFTDRKDKEVNSCKSSPSLDK